MQTPLTIRMNNYTISFENQEEAKRFIMWFSHHAKLVANLAVAFGESQEDEETIISLAFLQRDLNALINGASSFI
jgi:hypothetical protein